MSESLLKKSSRKYVLFPIQYPKIWDAYKKEPFFNRKLKDMNSQIVIIIEPPDPQNSKNNIPRNKYEHCDKN